MGIVKSIVLVVTQGQRKSMRSGRKLWKNLQIQWDFLILMLRKNSSENYSK